MHSILEKRHWAKAGGLSLKRSLFKEWDQAAEPHTPLQTSGAGPCTISSAPCLTSLLNWQLVQQGPELIPDCPQHQGQGNTEQTQRLL